MGSRQSRKKANLSIEKSERNFNRRPVRTHSETTNAQSPNSAAMGTGKLVTLVWFDSHSASQDDIIDTQNTKQILSNALPNVTLMCFSDLRSCIQFIEQQQDTVTNVFLVVSGRDSMALFNSLNTALFRCIDSIFIFCLSKKLYETQMLYEKKVVGIYREHTELLQSIQQQAARVIQQDLLLKYYSHTQKTARIVPSYAKGEFVWIRALKEAILQAEKNDKIRKNMYDRFRVLYRRDQKELEKIDEFEKNYCSEDAIEWYTKDSFLYRVVNQSLRTESTDELLIFAPYISDLCHAVRALQTKVDKTMKFFRGCTLCTTALDDFHSNIGSLLCINTFFSASRQRDVAKMFAGCHCMSGSKLDASVLFEIEIKESAVSFFADISKISPFASEEEVLFDLNAIFTIDNITYSDVDECWIIHLIADEETYAKHEYIYKELCDIHHLNASPIITVGISLIMIGNTREAYRHATRLPLTYHHISVFNLFFIMACIAECDYSRALNFLKQIYAYCEKSNSFEVHRGWTDVASCIGDILIALGEYRLASQYIESTVEYYATIEQSVYWYKTPVSVEYLTVLGKALQRNNEVEVNHLLLLGFDDEEIPPVTRALILPAAHARLARSLVNTNKLQDAFNELKRAEIEGEVLLSDHALVRQEIYLVYACICIRTKTFDQCYLYLNQAERIARMNLSRSSPSILGCAYLLRELVTILQENTDFESCLPLARTAFLRTENHIHVPNVAFVLSNLCEIHRKYQNYLSSSALDKLEQFLIEAFRICRFEKILEGKSPENIYRSLLTYVQQIVTSRAQNTQKQRREESQDAVCTSTMKALGGADKIEQI
jgi:hypothetical protein